MTDYFDVSEGDKIYLEVELPQEATSSTFLWNGQDANGSGATKMMFYKSFALWGNTAARRTYAYNNAYMQIYQETPAATYFINDVTGVTASYYSLIRPEDTEASKDVYNYTSSYWYAANNYSSSDEGIGCYLTASSALSFFYGGTYYQSNPS